MKHRTAAQNEINMPPATVSDAEYLYRVSRCSVPISEPQVFVCLNPTSDTTDNPVKAISICKKPHQNCMIQIMWFHQKVWLNQWQRRCTHIYTKWCSRNQNHEELSSMVISMALFQQSFEGCNQEAFRYEDQKWMVFSQSSDRSYRN